MEDKLRAGHITRLANNLCNVRSGVRYLDILTNLERISDHAMNNRKGMNPYYCRGDSHDKKGK